MITVRNKQRERVVGVCGWFWRVLKTTKFIFWLCFEYFFSPAASTFSLNLCIQVEISIGWRKTVTRAYRSNTRGFPRISLHYVRPTHWEVQLICGDFLTSEIVESSYSTPDTQRYYYNADRISTRNGRTYTSLKAAPNEPRTPEMLRF